MRTRHLPIELVVREGTVHMYYQLSCLPQSRPAVRQLGGVDKEYCCLLLGKEMAVFLGERQWRVINVSMLANRNHVIPANSCEGGQLF